MIVGIGRSASSKLKSIGMYLLSLTLVLGGLTFAAPQFFGQIAHAADTWSVDNSRLDDTQCATTFQCKTIQAAVTAAIGGDTINVAAGTYNLTSRVDVNKAVNIVGDVTTPSNVIINAPVAGGTQHGQNSVFMITSSNVTIQGFRIQGALHTGAAQNAGIYVDDPRLVSNPGLSNITISNNEVTDNGYGIIVMNIKDSTISDNKVFSNKKATGTGKYKESGIGIVVYGNAVDANHTSNLTISGNDVYDNDTEGIRVGVGDEVGPGYLALDMDITISGNDIYHNGSLIADTGFDTYIGIKSSGFSNGVTVTGNNIYNQIGTAISATSGNAGIQILVSKNWAISNNNIHDNANGVFFAYSKAFGSDSGSHTITGNDIYNNIRGISIDDGTEAVANNNSIYSNDSTAFSGIGFAPYNAYNSGSGIFDVTNNWWGNSDLATIKSKLASRDVSGNVVSGTTVYLDFTPYYIDSELTTLSNLNDITSFAILGQTGTTIIDNTNHTVAITMPYGTDVSNLIPTITTTGLSISPASGVEYDFTSPQAYTVTPYDEEYAQLYTVTVTVSVINPIEAGFNIDNTAPIVTINKPSDVTIGSVATISGTIDDLTSILQLAIGSNKYTLSSANISGTNWSYPLSTANLGTGTYTIKITAVDASGNTNYATTILGVNAPIVTGSAIQTNPELSLAVNNVAQTSADSQEDQAILGSETKSVDSNSGTEDKTATLSSTSSGWIIFGLMWYWWLAILAAIALIWWIIATAIHNNSDKS